MILLTIEQNIYIVCALIGVLLLTLLIIIFVKRNYLNNKNVDKAVYKKLYRLAQLNDYLLLNNYKLHISEKSFLTLNHVLISKKFSILINDFNYSGAISGSYNDEQLLLHDKNGERLILNSLTYNRNILKRVALLNDLDTSFLKGVVVFANDTLFDIKDIPSQYYVCQKKDLASIIKEIDSIDVKPFKDDTVERFIAKLDSINVKE